MGSKEEIDRLKYVLEATYKRDRRAIERVLEILDKSYEDQKRTLENLDTTVNDPGNVIPEYIPPEVDEVEERPFRDPAREARRSQARAEMDIAEDEQAIAFLEGEDSSQPRRTLSRGDLVKQRHAAGRSVEGAPQRTGNVNAAGSKQAHLSQNARSVIQKYNPDAPTLLQLVKAIGTPFTLRNLADAWRSSGVPDIDNGRLKEIVHALTRVAVLESGSFNIGGQKTIYYQDASSPNELREAVRRLLATRRGNEEAKAQPHNPNSVEQVLLADSAPVPLAPQASDPEPALNPHPPRPKKLRR